MGIALPQLAPASEDRVSGAQVIDGSLKFDGVYLKRTPGSAGNRRTFTWSAWVKLNKLASFYLFNVPDSSGHASLMFDSGQLRWNTYTTATNGLFTSDAYFRDTGWYHVVFVFDATLSTTTDRIKVYVNGERQTSSSYTAPDGTATPVNNTVEHNLGANRGSTSGDINITNNYLIDGQALGPESFGYADGLTNTWRPKKYEGVFNGDAVAAVSYSDNGQMSSSASFSAAPNDAAASFDGSIAGPDVPYLGGSSAEIVWTPTGTLSYSSQIEIYVGGISGFRYNLNNGGWNTPTINSWNTIATGSGTITTIKVDRGGDETHGWHAIRIDGTILVNSPAQNAGVNGFYLPMDGNSPIGEDKSGRGNNWTPVNFGGSVALPKATGAKPILNTDGGGKVARVGVFGSEVGAYYAVTVPGGIGGGYYLDGTQKPALSLIRGATYTFDQSDSSNSGHPLVFGTTADGNDYNDGVTTNGTPGSAGAYTKITVPHNAPDTLYYHCSAHGGMGNSTSQTTDETKADPYAWKNVLALPLVGGIDDVSADINATTTKKVATNSGSTSDNNSEFYGGSTNFDGSNDRITIPYSTDFTFDGDFTIEYWIFREGGSVWLDFAASGDYENSYQFYAAAGNMMFYVNSASATQVGGSGFMDVTSSVWTHHAVTRSGTTARAFENGILKKTTTLSGTLGNNTNNVFGLGAQNYGGAQAWYDGKLSDLRIYKGVAKYTSDFVVPATSPDILPDTPSGVSGGSALTKITDGAVSFDGTGDYLSIADSSDFTVGTNPFTLEFYAYKTAAGEDFFCGSYDSSGTTASLSYAVQTGGSSPTNSLVAHVAEGGSATSVNSGVDFVLNKWVHVAFVRDGNTLRLFQDGIQMSTAAFSGTVNDASNAFEIGRAGFSGKDFPGYISNFRFVNGTALYTTDFTPPTRELTNVTNTKLLCCQSNTSATEGAVKPGTITAAGNAVATNFNPFTTDINAVRGQETGYATLNPLETVSGITLSEGNLLATGSGATNKISTSTIPIPTSGKWWWEVKLESSNNGQIGIIGTTSGLGNWGNTYLGQVSTGYALDTSNGSKYNNGSNSSYISALGVGDIVNCSYDADSGSLRFYVNGLDKGNAFTGLTEQYRFGVSVYSTTAYSINFGQNPFKYAPPDGFQPLNAANVRPETVITRPDQYVGVTTYTGNGGTQSINVGLKPDLVWFKNRDQSYSHMLMDSVRGDGNTKWMCSDLSREQGVSSGNGDAVFTSDGFQLRVPSSTNTINGSGHDCVSWAWKAGGNKNTFNVDDIGYASASDVNMSVGGLNSSTYNTSAIWSGMMSGPSNSGVYTSLFDGTDGDAGGYEVATDGNTLTFTPTGGITATSSIEIYAYQSSGTYAGSADITVNGSSIKTGAVQSALGTGTAGGYVNIGTTSLTTLTWSNPSGSNNDYRLMAIKVDGKILVDSNQTPPNVPSIAATGCSVGTKQGFSIVKYTGNGNAATIPHGLSQTPTFLIKKFISASSNWDIWTPNIGADKRLTFTEDAAGSTTSYQNVNATTFDVHAGNNDDTVTMIAYLWHDVPGLQKFGKYTGVNSTDGPFLELGFRPSLIMFKNITSGSTEWVILDNKRNGFNGTAGNNILFPSTADQENATQYGDFLSNGWKFRINSSYVNAASNDYIYAAWAEAPTFNLYGSQSNAR